MYIMYGRRESASERPYMHRNWYLIHCEPQRDPQVERLVSHISLEAFAPRIPKSRRRNGDKPLFPGYVFVRMDLASGVWNHIRYLPGVRALVEIGGGPCPVGDEIVETIRTRVTTYQPGGLRLGRGDRVMVATGAFADLEGVFCEALSGEERVAILVDMMRRQVRIELSTDHIRLLDRNVEVA